jgi:hypothetical protein
VDSAIELLSFLEKLQDNSKYKVNWFIKLSEAEDFRIVCGVDSDSKEPIIPTNLHAERVIVTHDSRMFNLAIVVSKNAVDEVDVDPLRFGAYLLLNEPKPLPNVPKVVFYGNGGGIDNHLANATVVRYDTINEYVADLIKELARYSECKLVFGIKNPNLRCHAYDSRINKFVWMLTADHIGPSHITPSQFVKWCYFEDGSDRTMSLNKEIIKQQLSCLTANN